MANENRDRVLKHHEKPIWRDAFKESMKHTSIEGATRNAWKAVDEWNRAGAFNETSERNEPKVDVEEEASYCEAFGILRNWLGKLPVTVGANVNGELLFKTVLAFDDGEIDVEEFKTELHAYVG
jgi:hypothetical protein